MHVVAVINYKGGVGKTSLTANLGAQLAWEGHRVLMIDLDPQSSLTFSFLTPDVWEKEFAPKKTIKGWFDSFDYGKVPSLEPLIFVPKRASEILHGRGQLDLISSHLGLINVDLELATKLSGASLAQSKRNFIDVHSRLALGLGLIAHRDYDVVLIDCPPNFNIVTKTAIIASNYLLVPARPDYLSTLGIDYLIRSVDSLIKDYNDYADVKDGSTSVKIDPKVLGVVFTMIQEYGGGPMAAHKQYMAQVRRMDGVSVFEQYIKRNDTLFASAPQYSVPVVLHGYTSDSHRSVVSGLEDVTAEFKKALKLS
ncbi:MAG TPA: ParA family protein [Myxococcales bacterium]|nr:ParA family protein [Myxococcales bacterium]